MLKRTAEQDLESAKEDKSMVMDRISSTQQDLSVTIATLRDDQAYLLDLTQKCEEKSKAWDQRSKMREDELAAVGQALAVIKNVVVDKTTEKTIRFVEMDSKMKKQAHQIATPGQNSDDVDDADDKEKGEETSSCDDHVRREGHHVTTLFRVDADVHDSPYTSTKGPD